MKLKIIQEKDSKLFNRKELTYESSFEGKTPKNEEVKKAIAEAAKVKEDLILIKKIHQKFGTPTATIYAKIYATEEALKKAETRNKKQKKKEEKKTEEKK